MPLRVPTPLTPLWPQLKTAYTQATRAVAPATRQLSRVRGGYLPRRAVATADDSVASAGGRVWIARPEERVVRTIPPGDPPRHPKFVEWSEKVVPRVAVAELPQGRVLGPHRVVIDRRNQMIEEFGLYWGTTRWSEHEIFWHPFPGPPLEVDGLLGVLAGRGDLNYFHFLVEILPRLALFETEGVPTPDKWYVPLQHSYQREILELVGFLPRGEIIDADVHPHVRGERLLVPGLPDGFKRTPPWTIDFVRERLRPSGLELIPGRRIYVTRGDQRYNRIVTNEPEVVELLRSRGFDVVDPGAHSVGDQIRIFGEAECIVSPHGAGLTNVLFASAGAAVLEILSPNYVDVGFWKLAEAIPGLSYRYLLGSGPPPRPGREERDVMKDITVDLGALERSLDELPVETGPLKAAPRV